MACASKLDVADSTADWMVADTSGLGAILTFFAQEFAQNSGVLGGDMVR